MVGREVENLNTCKRQPRVSLYHEWRELSLWEVMEGDGEERVVCDVIFEKDAEGGGHGEMTHSRRYTWVILTNKFILIILL